MVKTMNLRALPAYLRFAEVIPKLYLLTPEQK